MIIKCVFNASTGSPRGLGLCFSPISSTAGRHFRRFINCRWTFSSDSRSERQRVAVGRTIGGWGMTESGAAPRGPWVGDRVSGQRWNVTCSSWNESDNDASLHAARHQDVGIRRWGNGDGCSNGRRRRRFRRALTIKWRQGTIIFPASITCRYFEVLIKFADGGCICVNAFASLYVYPDYVCFERSMSVWRGGEGGGGTVATAAAAAAGFDMADAASGRCTLMVHT